MSNSLLIVVNCIYDLSSNIVRKGGARGWQGFKLFHRILLIAFMFYINSFKFFHQPILVYHHLSIIHSSFHYIRLLPLLLHIEFFINPFKVFQTFNHFKVIFHFNFSSIKLLQSFVFYFWKKDCVIILSFITPL